MSFLQGLLLGSLLADKSKGNSTDYSCQLNNIDNSLKEIAKNSSKSDSQKEAEHQAIQKGICNKANYNFKENGLKLFFDGDYVIVKFLYNKKGIEYSTTDIDRIRIPLLMWDPNNETVIKTFWDRSESYIKALNKLYSEYYLEKPVFKIKRNGNAGDINTTYDLSLVSPKIASYYFKDQ